MKEIDYAEMYKIESSLPEHLKAIRESIISMTIKYASLVNSEDINKDNIDIRENIGIILDEMVTGIALPPDNWNNLLHPKPYYDEYIRNKKENATITKADLIRSGLIMSDFSSPAAYYEHCRRVTENRSISGENEKICRGCNKAKPMSKFRARGGSLCNACRSKQYRNRKKPGIINLMKSDADF